MLVHEKSQRVFGNAGVHGHARWKQRNIGGALLRGHSLWPRGVARPIGPDIQLVTAGSQGKRSAFKLRQEVDQTRGLIAHGGTHLFLDLGAFFLLLRGIL